MTELGTITDSTTIFGLYQESMKPRPSIDMAYSLAMEDEEVLDGPRIFSDASVSIARTLNPLEAEADALLLGAKIAAALNLHRFNLLTDIEIVATAARKGSPRSHPGHWTMRPMLR
ncbi:hypothetical protein U9M48_001648 [Paspalum notatum var. saurae]|uniref:Uncharacterized protein n=1 Tax=Paspalum notatum var. saurae TaxID=547442 RepID=A0AAQ3SD22_PASNO